MEPLSLKPVKDKKNGCVDLDGVLNLYDHWVGEDTFPDPRPGAEWFLRELSKQFNVFILTVRENKEALQAWLEKHNLAQYVSGITNTKIGAHFYLDDRAIQFRGDFHEALERIVKFEPYWKKKR